MFGSNGQENTRVGTADSLYGVKHNVLAMLPWNAIVHQ
jgi:hypothetical protein